MQNLFKSSYKKISITLCLCLIGIFILNACSDQFDEVQQQVTSGKSIVANGSERAKQWFDQLTPTPVKGAFSKSRGTAETVIRSSRTKYPLNLNWARATVIKNAKANAKVWLVPTAENNAVGNRYNSRRYVVFIEYKNSFSGNIIEIHSKGDFKGENKIQEIATAFAKDGLHFEKKPIPDFEGAAIVYTLNYDYIQGRRYNLGQIPIMGERLLIKRKGLVLKPNMQNSLAQTSTCSDSGPCGPGCEERHYVYDSTPDCVCPPTGGGGTDGGSTTAGSTTYGSTTSGSTTFDSTSGSTTSGSTTSGGPNPPDDGGWGGGGNPGNGDPTSNPTNGISKGRIDGPYGNLVVTTKTRSSAGGIIGCDVSFDTNANPISIVEIQGFYSGTLGTGTYRQTSVSVNGNYWSGIHIVVGYVLENVAGFVTSKRGSFEIYVSLTPDWYSESGWSASWTMTDNL